MAWITPGIFDANALSISGGLLQNGSGQPFADAYWSDQQYLDILAYITVTTVGAADTSIAISGRCDLLKNGYRMYAYKRSGTDEIRFYVVTANGATVTQIGSTLTQEFANGDKLALVLSGSRMEAWRLASGSGTWTFVGGVTDTTYTSQGYVDVEIQGGTYRLDEFAVNPIQPTPFSDMTVTDTFNRANEGPPPSSNWTTGIFA